mmetsp:Transcript_137614/g.383827  ORF Transcript_137614/g.383827 Transcript_137614/m.383827 type:complete len:365 (+) Transcript_137614:265-1359(+)
MGAGAGEAATLRPERPPCHSAGEDQVHCEDSQQSGHTHAHDAQGRQQHHFPEEGGKERHCRGQVQERGDRPVVDRCHCDSCGSEASRAYDSSKPEGIGKVCAQVRYERQPSLPFPEGHLHARHHHQEAETAQPPSCEQVLPVGAEEEGATPVVPGRAEEHRFRSRPVQDDPPSLKSCLQHPGQQPQARGQRWRFGVPARLASWLQRTPSLEQRAGLAVGVHVALAVPAQVEVRDPLRQAPGWRGFEAEGHQTAPALHTQDGEGVQGVAPGHVEEADADIAKLGLPGIATTKRVVEHGIVPLHKGPLTWEGQRVCQEAAGDACHGHGTARAHSQGGSRTTLLQLFHPLVLSARQHLLEAFRGRRR